jgi:cellulose biosynthesis protein BcsQ
LADIICVIGSKGGTGKTTLTHMLGHGLSLLEHRPVCIFTDSHRETLDSKERRYRYGDARNPVQLEACIGQLRDQDDLGIVDGETGHGDVDRTLYGLADLVLLPFRDSSEDIQSVLRDMAQFPQAYAVPCQWPTNLRQQRVANRLLDECLGHYKNQILQPVFAHSTTKLLLNHRIPDIIPATLNNACRDLAQQIIRLLSLLPQTHNPKQAVAAVTTCGTRKRSIAV